MNILFLCVANSARSQLAEGLARKHFSVRHKFFSAGSVPSKINPLAVQVLEEVGIDASNQHSKSIEAIDLNSIDLIITLCAEEVCPVVHSKVKRLHWPFPDPAGRTGTDEEQLTIFRQTRDDIEHRLKAFQDIT